MSYRSRVKEAAEHIKLNTGLNKEGAAELLNDLLDILFDPTESERDDRNEEQYRESVIS